jgi:pilus assembly protein CpaB
MVLALVAAFMVHNAIARRGGPVAGASNLVSVVVARRDVEPGGSLSKEDMVVAKVPAELAPGHVFSDLNQLVGRVATIPLSKGETIMESLLAPTGTGQGLQALIPPGMRAMTIEVNEYSGVGGMLEPGCRVDLIANLNDPKTHEAMSKTILQDVKVGAIGRNVTPQHPVEGQPPAPPSNSVTLILSPEQVQTLQLATMTGRPWFSLRGSKDLAQVALAPMPVSKLRGDDGGDPTSQTQPVELTAPQTDLNAFAPVDAAPEQPKTVTRTVTIIRDGVPTRTTFVVPVAPTPHPEHGADVNVDPSPLPGGQ